MVRKVVGAGFDLERRADAFADRDAADAQLRDLKHTLDFIRYAAPSLDPDDFEGVAISPIIAGADYPLNPEAIWRWKEAG